MQAAKETKRQEPESRTRRRNADSRKKRRTIEPVEGSQTGSEGLGYLKEPDNAEETEKPKQDQG